MASIARKRTRFLSSVVLAVLVLGASAEPAAAKKKRSGGARPDIPRAQVALDIKMDDALAVRTAFRLAYRKVLEVPACGALFGGLDLDGPTALASTSYSSSRPGPERALCNRGVLAVAREGGTEIRLCPKLRAVAPEGVAAILIHEALHTAGLGEYPVDPEGQTSREITLTVLDACSLG